MDSRCRQASPHVVRSEEATVLKARASLFRSGLSGSCERGWESQQHDDNARRVDLPCPQGLGLPAPVQSTEDLGEGSAWKTQTSSGRKWQRRV